GPLVAAARQPHSSGDVGEGPVVVVGEKAAGDVEIDPAIAVIVHRLRPFDAVYRGHAAQRDASRIGDVGETPGAIVDEEVGMLAWFVVDVIGNEPVDPAVVVEIGG